MAPTAACGARQWSREHPHRTRYAVARRPHPPLRQRLLPVVPRGAARPRAHRGAAAVRVAGRARGADLARAGLREPRAGAHPLRRVPRDPQLPRGVDRAHEGAHAGRDRQLRPGAGGLRRRAARDADPAHLHPARGPARPLQPQVPDLLRRVGTGARVGRAARAGAGLDRHPPVARERPDRRAHAQRWRADALPVAGRAARRRGRPSDRAGPGQHQRPGHRQGRRDARAAAPPPRPGRGLPAVRRRVGRGVHPPPRCRHPAVQGAGDRPALRCRDLHDAHDDGRARGQRRRDRSWSSARSTPPTSVASPSSPCSARDAAPASTRTTASPTPVCWPGWTGRRPAR